MADQSAISPFWVVRPCSQQSNCCALPIPAPNLGEGIPLPILQFWCGDFIPLPNFLKFHLVQGFYSKLVRSFGAPIPKMLAHAHSRTLCSCKMCIDPLGDHVLTCKQHTGCIRGHNHLMDMVASLSRDSKISPVRVNHKVSTTGDGTRKQGIIRGPNLLLSHRAHVNHHVQGEQDAWQHLN